MEWGDELGKREGSWNAESTKEQAQLVIGDWIHVPALPLTCVT